MQTQQVSPYFTLATTASIAIITSVATLVGVYLTQRAARRNQQVGLEAAAALERERRTHELAVDEARRSAERTDRRWDKRAELYGRLLASADALVTLPLAAPDPATALAKMHDFWALSYEVSLVAPRQMALAATLLTERTRRAIITTGKESEHKEAMERVREMRASFLDAGRRDLGIDTEPLLKAHVADKKSAETPPSSSAAG